MFVSDKAISKWETGEGVPDISNLLELTKVFGVSMDYIIKGEGANGIEQKVTVQESVEVEHEEIIEVQVKTTENKPLKDNKKSVDEIIALASKQVEAEQNNKKKSVDEILAQVNQQVEQQKPKQVVQSVTNASLIVSFVLSAVSFFTSIFFSGIIGVIIAIVGMVLALNKSNRKNKLWVTALILNILAFVIAVVFTVLFVLLISYIGFGFGEVINGFTDPYIY